MAEKEIIKENAVCREADSWPIYSLKRAFNSFQQYFGRDKINIQKYQYLITLIVKH